MPISAMAGLSPVEYHTLLGDQRERECVCVSVCVCVESERQARKGNAGWTGGSDLQKVVWCRYVPYLQGDLDG